MNDLAGDGLTVPTGSDGLRVSEDWYDRIVVVAAVGDLDMFTAPQLAHIADAAAGKEPAAMILDLTNVKFLASASMNLLVDVQRAITRSARFAIVADGPATRRPLMLTGIDNVMTVYESLDTALAAFARA